LDTNTGRWSAVKIVNLGAADGLPPVNWAVITERLEAGSAPAPEAHNSRTKWLTTLNEDGSPHVTAVGAIWLDDTFWFQTGAGTRKSRNIERDPRCSIALSILDADVVVDGKAVRVRDPHIVARLAAAWAADGWPAEPDVSGSGITAPFNAPSQGPPPWFAYRVEPRSATVVLGIEPGGLTRFRF
jgi:Pyridoxamine 5'-phosphate oxidase